MCQQLSCSQIRLITAKLTLVHNIPTPEISVTNIRPPKGKAILFGSITASVPQVSIKLLCLLSTDITITINKQLIDQSTTNMQVDVPDANNNLPSDTAILIVTDVNNNPNSDMEIWEEDPFQLGILKTNINKPELFATGLTILGIENLQSNRVALDKIKNTILTMGNIQPKKACIVNVYNSTQPTDAQAEVDDITEDSTTKNAKVKTRIVIGTKLMVVMTYKQALDNLLAAEFEINGERLMFEKIVSMYEQHRINNTQTSNHTIQIHSTFLRFCASSILKFFECYGKIEHYYAQHSNCNSPNKQIIYLTFKSIEVIAQFILI
ncbi:hypothetical protein RclHR1_05210003 [Rhizophagus clarus]|uniref:Uncharacterized protein n=1 Tax=Rhizophagus clarus TaxID=94130 RepID=A0A2Z6RRS6_9GLOM|nr:hypothetical protein RclHR1_05210003 [Rhizophagus clarus]